MSGFKNRPKEHSLLKEVLLQVWVNMVQDGLEITFQIKTICKTLLPPSWLITSLVSQWLEQIFAVSSVTLPQNFVQDGTCLVHFILSQEIIILGTQ
jgi:hypothetical protein